MPRTVSSVLRAATTGVVAVIVLAACRDESAYPRTWSPLQAPATTAGARPDSTASPSCPDLRGTYGTTDEVLYGNVVARFLSREQRDIRWHALTIEPRDPDSLAFRVVRGDLQDSVTVARHDMFRCADGWLTGPWPGWLIKASSDDQFDDTRGYTRQLWMTRDQDGRLIGREEIVSYREIAVWCGDGCRYLRVPGTRRVEVRWHRVSKPALTMDLAPEPEGDPAINARIAREDSLLEWGPPPR